MYRKSIFDNEIKVVTESIPYVRSVSIGIWVNVGSKEEAKLNNGISHFLEHMLFKGTENRTAQDIAAEIDAIGGQFNAFTSRELTCFYIKILDEYLPKAVDLLSDIFLKSIFDKEEIERERQVILEEIKMSEDTPDEYAHDLFVTTMWADHLLGQPILGSKDTVKQIARGDLFSFFNKYYQGNRIVIAAAGNLKHEDLVDLLRDSFDKLSGQSPLTSHLVPHLRSNISVKTRDLEQVYFCAGTKGLKQNHPDRYAIYLLNTILGGSMSSRLFQEIREKRGLAYSIYSYMASYHDTGLMASYASVDPLHFEEVLDLILCEFKKLKANTVLPAELRRAKDQLKGNLILNLESTSSRMNKLASHEIYFNRYFTLDETLQAIEQVTSKQILNLANEIFKDEYLTVAALGPIKGLKTPRQVLNNEKN